jgi:hypothetical protein
MVAWHSRGIAAGFAVLALGLSAAAQAEQPGFATVTTDPTRGFDAAEPGLRLDASTSDARAGLAPGQDLRGTAPALSLSLPSAELDSYTNSKDYEQLLSHYAPKKPLTNGKQLGGLRQALVKAAILTVKDKIIEPLKEELADRIEAGEVSPAAGLALDAADAAAKVKTVLTDLK